MSARDEFPVLAATRHLPDAERPHPAYVAEVERALDTIDRLTIAVSAYTDESPAELHARWAAEAADYCGYAWEDGRCDPKAGHSCALPAGHGARGNTVHVCGDCGAHLRPFGYVTSADVEPTTPQTPATVHEIPPPPTSAPVARYCAHRWHGPLVYDDRVSGGRAVEIPDTRAEHVCAKGHGHEVSHRCTCGAYGWRDE